MTGENGLTTHCDQIESCGVFLVNGDTLAQINLDHVSNFKEVKGGSSKNLSYSTKSDSPFGYNPLKKFPLP